MKRIMLCLAVVAAALPLTAVGTSSASASKNIVQIAAGNPQFTTLVALVKKAGLVNALSGSAKLTVFAPTNAAFAKLPKATVTKLEHNPKLLAKVLEYHVLAGLYPASRVIKTHSAKTLEGARVTFSVRGGKAYINSSQIVKTDIHASNGIVHVLNRVLSLPS